jgi:hypothetical protein
MALSTKEIERAFDLDGDHGGDRIEVGRLRCLNPKDAGNFAPLRAAQFLESQRGVCSDHVGGEHPVPDSDHGEGFMGVMETEKV